VLSIQAHRNAMPLLGILFLHSRETENNRGSRFLAHLSTLSSTASPRRFCPFYTHKKKKTPFPSIPSHLAIQSTTVLT